MLKWMAGWLTLLGGTALAGSAPTPQSVDAQRNQVKTHAAYPVSPEALKLHQRLTVADWHADTLLWDRDLLQRHPHGHVDLPRLLDGNVAIQGFTVVTKTPGATDRITQLVRAHGWPSKTHTSLTERALYQAEALHQFAKRSQGKLRVIRTRSDLDQVLTERAAGQSIVGGVLGLEGAHGLEGDIRNLDRLERAGFRIIGLHHFFDNRLGGSLHGTSGQGLTDFGRHVVLEVEKRPMLIDLAHSSSTVARDVLSITDKPLIVSHTGVYAACPSPRNFSDDLMQAIADQGGVIGIGYFKSATCRDDLDGILRSIRAAITVVGIDHVSLGSDFDGSVTTPLDTSELAAITQGLLQGGMSETDIAKVMGGNLIRVLKASLL